MTTTPVTSLVQPPVEDLRNSLMIAQSWGEMAVLDTDDARGAFQDIARLILHALDQLGEPSLAATHAAATMIREYEGSRIAEGDLPRYARDTAAVIIRAQITGDVPPTWSQS